MANKFILITVICFFSNATIAQNTNLIDGKPIVARVYTVLNSLKNVQYNYSRIIDAKSELYYNNYEGKMQMLFTPNSKIGIFYLFEDKEHGFTTYNGYNEYYVNKNLNLASQEKKSIKDLNAKSFLNPSLNTIKTNFEWLSNTDKYAITTADTVIEDKKYSNIYFQFKGSILSPNEKELEKLESNITFYYTVIVNAATLLPYKLIRKYNLNKEDIITTTFTNYAIDNVNITEKTFSPKNFKESANTKIEKEVNNITWELPVLDSNKTIKKEDLVGKVVMLEFFFIGCQPCKKAIPWLATLKEKYKDSPFVLYSVNALDSKAALEMYKRQNKEIKYDILYDADALVKDYLIQYYPTVMLFNKKGKLVYFGPLLHSVEKLIKKNL